VVEAALKQIGYEKLLLDADAQTVELTHLGMRLDLGSIAKGYAGDEAIRVLREQGIAIAAYEAGGDKVFGDAPPGQKGWPIEIDEIPLKLSPLANCAISISSDSAQHLEYDGKRVSHVLDPQTGTGFSPRTTCVVVASRGIDSDPLATLGTMMPTLSYQMLLKRHFPEVRATVSEPSDNNEPNPPRIPSL